MEPSRERPKVIFVYIQQECVRVIRTRWSRSNFLFFFSRYCIIILGNTWARCQGTQRKWPKRNSSAQERDVWTYVQSRWNSWFFLSRSPQLLHANIFIRTYWKLFSLATVRRRRKRERFGWPEMKTATRRSSNWGGGGGNRNPQNPTVCFYNWNESASRWNVFFFVFFCET